MAKSIQKSKNTRRKLVVARIDESDYKALKLVAKTNSRSVGAEIKHQLKQILAA